MTHIFDEQTKVINPTDDPVNVDSELLPTRDLSTIGLLEQIFTVLKKIEYHLSIATDTNLNDQDVGG